MEPPYCVAVGINCFYKLLGKCIFLFRAVQTKKPVTLVHNTILLSVYLRLYFADSVRIPAERQTSHIQTSVLFLPKLDIRAL
jgi:hypothetical protein